MSKKLFIMIGLLMIGSAQAGATPLSSLLPESDEMAGWTTYRWPRDADGLYGLIDGAGVVYLNHGFQEAVFQDFYDADLAEMMLEIYDQGIPANAESTYHDPILEMGWEVPRDDFGTEGRLDTTALVSYMAEFWRNQYFVRGVVHQKNASALEALESLCQSVDQKLTGPSAVDGLPADGEIPGWNRFLLAIDSLSLASLLEGQEDLFLQWGCQAGIRQDYYDHGFVSMKLELFDQSSSANAQSLYHNPGLETGWEVPRGDFGQEGRLDTTSSWTVSAQFWRERYLARLEIQEKSDSSLASLVTFCRLVDQKIQATSVEEALSPPQEPGSRLLWRAFPNPFNDHVSIEYRIPWGEAAQAPFRLDIYNVQGQRIRRLAEIQGVVLGWHVARWDGRDDRGREVASGVYFCRLYGGSWIGSTKLVLCR